MGDGETTLTLPSLGSTTITMGDGETTLTLPSLGSTTIAMGDRGRQLLHYLVWVAPPSLWETGGDNSYIT